MVSVIAHYHSARSFQRPPRNSRVAWLLLDSEVIQRVEIAESPVKRAFCGGHPPPVPYSPGLPHPTANSQAYTAELIQKDLTFCHLSRPSARMRTR